MSPIKRLTLTDDLAELAYAWNGFSRILRRDITWGLRWLADFLDPDLKRK